MRIECYRKGKEVWCDGGALLAGGTDIICFGFLPTAEELKKALIAARDRIASARARSALESFKKGIVYIAVLFALVRFAPYRVLTRNLGREGYLLMAAILGWFAIGPMVAALIKGIFWWKTRRFEIDLRNFRLLAGPIRPVPLTIFPPKKRISIPQWLVSLSLIAIVASSVVPYGEAIAYPLWGKARYVQRGNILPLSYIEPIQRMETVIVYAYLSYSEGDEIIEVLKLTARVEILDPVERREVDLRASLHNAWSGVVHQLRIGLEEQYGAEFPEPEMLAIVVRNGLISYANLMAEEAIQRLRWDFAEVESYTVEVAEITTVDYMGYLWQVQER
jgi:hypothetical protein